MSDGKLPPFRIDPSTGSTGQVLRKGVSGDVEFGPLAVPTKASDLTTVILPITAVTAGVPSLVWDSSFNLVVSEVPYP